MMERERCRWYMGISKIRFHAANPLILVPGTTGPVSPVASITGAWDVVPSDGYVFNVVHFSFLVFVWPFPLFLWFQCRPRFPSCVCLTVSSLFMFSMPFAFPLLCLFDRSCYISPLFMFSFSRYKHKRTCKYFPLQSFAWLRRCC